MDANGTVTAVSAGTVTITADMAADATYAAASASYSLTVTAPVAALGFTSAGPLSLIVGEVAVNAASSASAGAISYSSSNPAVADVDGSGQVTAFSDGSVTITANQVADGSYPADSASYQLDVVTASFTLTAWLGADDTLVDFSAGTDGLAFYRSSAADCDIANYSLCANGQLSLLNGTTVTDTAANVDRSGFYTFAHGANQVATRVSHQVFQGRAYTDAVVFNDEIVMVGGSPRALDCTNDVWTSTDGGSWVELTDSAAFTERQNHKITVFNNRLWLVGGMVPGTYGFCDTAIGDVWYSDDGVTWTLATDSPGFSPRFDHALVAFDNKLWVIGGAENSVTYTNDVWSSSDGINWTQETGAAAFSARKLHNVAELSGTLYLVGGQSGGVLRDVWSSTDGANWSQVTANGGFNRADKLTTFNNRLWIMNLTYGAKNEMWYSSDGASWTNSTINPKFPTHYWPALVAFDNKLFFIGGRSLGATYYNDVWYLTPAATSWTRAMPGANFPLRYGHAGLSFNGKLWVISGYDGYDFYPDIWSSSDGVSWNQETGSTGFSGRHQHKVIDFGGKLWLFGGIDYSGRKYDQWSSLDGVSWSEEAPHAVLTDRYAFQLAVFNGRLWLFGGRSSADDSQLDEVWSTVDGLNWSQELAANFPERADTRVFVYNSALWMAGGSDSGFLYRDDVWTSSDGLNWSQVNASAPFNPRTNPQLFELNNRLWMTGGDSGSFWPVYNDVWSTTDGIIWTEENVDAAFYERSRNPVVEFNGQPWMLGGYQSSTIFFKDIWTTTDGANWRTPQRKTVSFP